MSERESLLIRPSDQGSEYHRLSPERAGWELLHFGARRLRGNARWDHSVGENEMVLVLLGGRCHLRSNRHEWLDVGRRPDVFSGMPYALYLPRNSELSVEATGESLDLAYAWCATDQDHPAKLITPEQIFVEIRGGGNATRQINDILPPGFDCHRLVAVEVYTPSGNWSSYPPHKHDEHRVDASGNLIEADLEEVYFYKIDRPEGYAYQRIYTADGRYDELMLARNDDLILSPEGYHPVVSAHGYTSYYLNFLAGSAQSLASTYDPQFAWICDTWTEKDPRLPIVSLEMES